MCWMRERSWVLILTSIFSCASFACLCVAVVTDHWLYASERLNNTDLFRNTTAGLWRKCINDVSFVPADWCERIDYFKHIERDGLAPTDSILLSLRKFALFPLLSLLILLVGECCCVVSQCNPQKNTLTLVSGIMFVIGGLFVLIGMVIFIGAVTEEASNSKSKSSADDHTRPFYYRYGPSFILTIFSFISSEGTGVLSVYLYISLYQSAYRKDRDHLEIPVDVNSEALSPSVPEQQSQERQCLSNRFNRSRSDILMENTLLPDDDDASNICTSPLVDSVGSDAALLSGLLKSPAEWQGRNKSGALNTLFSPVSIQKNKILQNQHQTRLRKDGLALPFSQKKAHQSRKGSNTLGSGQGDLLLMDSIYCYDHVGHRNAATTVATTASTVILNPSVVAQPCDHHISTIQQQQQQQKAPSQQAYRFVQQPQQLLQQVQQFTQQQTHQFLKQSKPLKTAEELQHPALQELAQKQSSIKKRSLLHRQDSLYQKHSKQPTEQPQNLPKKSQHRPSHNRHDWLTNSPSPTALYKDSATQYSPLLAQSTAPISFKTFDALQQEQRGGVASPPKSRKNASRPSRDFSITRDLNSKSSNKRDFNENRIYPHQNVNRTFHASERQNQEQKRQQQQQQHTCLQRQCSSSFRQLDHTHPVDDIITLDESPLTGSSCMARSAYYLPLCGDVKNTDDWSFFESPFDRAKSMHELRYFSYCNPQHLKSLVQPLLDDDSSFFFGRTTPV